MPVSDIGAPQMGGRFSKSYVKFTIVMIKVEYGSTLSTRSAVKKGYLENPLDPRHSIHDPRL